MESVEASGRTIEDAILQALARLGRNRNEVEITVLQEPSRGVAWHGRARGPRARFRAAPRVRVGPAGRGAVAAPDDEG